MNKYLLSLSLCLFLHGESFAQAQTDQVNSCLTDFAERQRSLALDPEIPRHERSSAYRVAGELEKFRDQDHFFQYSVGSLEEALNPSWGDIDPKTGKPVTGVAHNTVIKAKILHLGPGTIPVKNGSTLYLDADRIVIHGNLIIDGSGQNGKDGRTLFLPKDTVVNATKVEWLDVEFTCLHRNLSWLSGHDGEAGAIGGIVVFKTQPILTDGAQMQIRTFGGDGGKGEKGFARKVTQNYFGRIEQTLNCQGRDGTDGPRGLDGATFILNNCGGLASSPAADIQFDQTSGAALTVAPAQ